MLLVQAVVVDMPDCLAELAPPAPHVTVSIAPGIQSKQAGLHRQSQLSDVSMNASRVCSSMALPGALRAGRVHWLFAAGEGASSEMKIKA